MSYNNQTESKYFCAGRYCAEREKCHRHTSSVHVNEAPFNDYDLVRMKEGLTKPCRYFIDRDAATGIVSSQGN